jgi:hypothetical protein
MDSETYKIVRFYQSYRPKKVIKSGLTREEAEAHCQRPDTHGPGWFDGFTKETDDSDWWEREHE